LDCLGQTLVIVLGPGKYRIGGGKTFGITP
jgi:hypothetical protein